MNYKIVVLFFSLIIISCGGSKTSSSAEKLEQKHVPAPVQPFTYTLRFVASGSMKSPHDEIYIDSSGQMIFNTDQHLKNGLWKTPRGMAYLEARDEDTLLQFIKQDNLFSIVESDVSPQCPEGDHFTLKIHRSDLKKDLFINTNTCAAEYNLLTGSNRKVFPDFLSFIGRLRDRYRPALTE